MSNALDCDDTDATVHPDVSERLNKADDDCSDVVDDLVTTDATTRINGDGDLARFGFTLATGTDFDEDGLTDLLVGSLDGGAVSVFSGAIGAGTHDAGDAMFSIEPPIDDAGFGWVLAPLADFNADGIADLVIAAPDVVVAEGGSGRLFVYLGSPGGMVAPITPTFEVDAAPGDTLGKVTVTDGIMDGESGFRSFIVDGTTPARGLDGVIFYATSWADEETSIDDGGPSIEVVGEISSMDDSEEFGASVVAGMDLDGDGLEDVAIGAPAAICSKGDLEPCGALYIFLDLASSDEPGGFILTSEAADRVIWAESIGDELGASVAQIPDWDGDGKADLVVGAPEFGDADGRAYVIGGVMDGDEADADLVAEAILTGPSGQLGYAVAAPGDMDGDGQAELVLGVPGLDTAGPHSGGAVLFWSDAGTGVLSPDATITGESAMTMMGTVVGGVVETSTGAMTDVVLGGWAADVEDGGDPEVETGAVWFFSD